MAETAAELGALSPPYGPLSPGMTSRRKQHVAILFGVPGAYCSPLFDVAIRQGMRTVVTASDLEAGYAADGYARIKGGWARQRSPTASARPATRSPEPSSSAVQWWSPTAGRPRRAFQPAPVRRRALPLDRAARDRSFRLQARHRRH
jgi:hypothetical protein